MNKLALFLIFISISTNICLGEEEIPVNIKADKLKYSEDGAMITASGSVEIAIKGVRIIADRLVMDTRTKVVTAEGNVTMRGRDYDASSGSMTYYVSNETSAFNSFFTTIHPSTVKGNLYLGAGKILDRKNRWDGWQGSITTCDYARTSSAHYTGMAQKVEYYPDDKIIGYSNTIFLGRIPVLWVPYIIYDLKGKRKKNWSVGHNEVEGNFIKTFWDYPNGVIMLDQMEKKGFGHGLDYNYDLGIRGSGKLYLYLLNENDGQNLKDRVFKLNHTIKPGQNTSLSIGHTSSNIYLVPSGRLDQSTYSLNYGHSKEKQRFSGVINTLDNRGGNQERMTLQTNYGFDRINTSYNFDLDQAKTGTRYIRSSQRMTHSQPFFLNNSNFNFNASYFNNIRQAGTPGDELMDINYDITGNERNYSWKITETRHVDLDRDAYLDDDLETFIEKMPEATLRLNAYDLKLFSLSPSLSYGYYREVTQVPNFGRRDYATGKYSTAVELNRSIPLALGSSLYLYYGIDQYLYEPGDQMYAQEEKYSLDTELLDCIENNATFSRGIASGNSPFLFDRQGTKFSDIREKLSLYYQNYFRWVTTGGYNFETKKYFNIDTSLSINPHPAVTANFITGWDIENQRYIDLTSNFGFNPFKNLSNSLTLLTDLNTGLLKSGGNLLNFEVFNEKNWENHWQFKLGHIYEPNQRQFKLVDLMAIKDLHCWEIKYTYSDYRKEFSLTFTLKALPGEPIGYAEGKGFYFDSFERSLKEELEGASPARY